jgi:hypothetical protein
MANMVLRVVKVVRFPDDGPLRAETRSNIQCDII